MAIHLRSDENLVCEAHFHWTSYLVSGVWAGIFTLSIIGHLLTLMFAKESTPVSFEAIAVIGYAPICWVWLRNKSKCYVVTNQRIYVEDGVLSKSKRDIPLTKVNDITFSQGVFQRMFGSGNVMVMTGNDKPTKLVNLEDPEGFRAAVSRLCNPKAA